MIGDKKQVKLDSVQAAKKYLGEQVSSYATEEELKKFVDRPCNNIGRAVKWYIHIHIYIYTCILWFLNALEYSLKKDPVVF